MSDQDETRAQRIERSILRVRAGHGANCSSIGSVVDTLFASAVIGGAIFAAVAAAMARESDAAEAKRAADTSERDPTDDEKTR